VSLDCPTAKGRSLIGRTDGNGRLSVHDDGHVLSEVCDIFVGDKKFPLKTVCVESKSGQCVHVVVSAEVAPPAGVVK
jgi:hypothetical protein